MIARIFTFIHLHTLTLQHSHNDRNTEKVFPILQAKVLSFVEFVGRVGMHGTKRHLKY